MLAQRGLFIGGPGRRLSALHERYFAMTGTDCLGFLFEARVGCLLHDLSTTHMPLSTLRRGVLSLPPLRPRTSLSQPPLLGKGAPQCPIIW